MFQGMIPRYALVLPLLFGGLASTAVAQPDSLKTVRAPLPDNLRDFIRNRSAAVQLGKALFWDEQTGGDGRIACATCHFNSGVDSRSTNTLHPGANGMFDNGVLPGGTLTPADFPLAGDDVVGSQGIVRRDFLGLDPGNPLAVDLHVLINDGTFFPNRQVTGRNTPNFIMSIFNEVNFWDGRAVNDFNGADPGGAASMATVLNGRNMIATAIDFAPASLSSQTVGPPNNGTEMSAQGRIFAELGRKLLGRTPLGLQQVAPDDSVLGGWSAAPANGLTTSYAELIQAAFKRRWYNSSQLTADGFTQMEANFSLFWGISIALYNSRQIPNDTPFDRWAEGDATAMTASQMRGMELFTGEARCDQCHDGPAFTGAAMGDAGSGDDFANIGVTPTAEDPGAGEGMFKVPTLRNVEFTGPYFHNGKYLTLRQVVEFYNRGGDVDNPEKDSQIRPLELSERDKTDLVNFLLALSDDRVRWSMAPFDHPSISPPNGTPIPANGAGGAAAPLGTFLGVDPHIH